jgi:hypothetical protein
MARCLSPGTMRPSGGPSGGGAFVAHTPEVVAVTATTCRWAGGARGRGVRSVGERTTRGRPCLFQGAQVVEARSSPTHRRRRRRPPPPLPLIGGRAARMVEGSGRCGGTDGGVVLVFQGARVVEVHSSPTHRSRRRQCRYRCHS